ncbi:MAG: hypothetical protein IIV78_00970, partial [Oscillospiraceae bacterium]|nr:hypothetical protein [Oscillospiraceae bacterium]
RSRMHTGHRERMRERVERTGAQALADHELLEMLLYYVQPRRDTNETAHALIEECGALSSVLEAPEERLCRVPAVGAETALYLRLLGELSRRYALGKLETRKDPMQVVYDSPEKIAKLMFPRFLGQVTERMYALLFDAGMHLSDVFCVGEGTVNSVSITARAVAERAYQRNAASVVLAHNHPGGAASPSAEDLELTRQLHTALALVGVPLIEHFVFTERAYFPIIAGCGAREELDMTDAMRAAQVRRLLDEKM